MDTVYELKRVSIFIVAVCTVFIVTVAPIALFIDKRYVDVNTFAAMMLTNLPFTVLVAHNFTKILHKPIFEKLIYFGLLPTYIAIAIVVFVAVVLMNYNLQTVLVVCGYSFGFIFIFVRMSIVKVQILKRQWLQ